MPQPQEAIANEWEVPGSDHVYDAVDMHISPEEMVKSSKPVAKPKKTSG